MKILYLRGQTNWRYMLLGLMHNAVEALKTIIKIAIIFALIFAPIIYVLEKKTSNGDFCPRIADPKVAEQLHCPISKPLVIK